MGTKAPEDHRKFLENKPYKLTCRTIPFSLEEVTLLERYGYWLEALATGAIHPFTPSQERFVKVSTGEVEPESLFEVAWVKLCLRRDYEREVATNGEYRPVDGGHVWFPIGAVGCSLNYPPRG